MSQKYDVIIVGAGAAGIFATLKLIEETDLSVLILEKGLKLNQRTCLVGKDPCSSCHLCSKTSGWGGAGAFSDGKLNIAQTSIGVSIADFIDTNDFGRLVKMTDDYWLEFGAPKKVYGLDSARVAKIRRRAEKVGLIFKVSPIRHLGTDGSIKVLGKMFSFLENRVQIKFRAEVEKILIDKKNHRARGVVLKNGQKYLAKHLVICPGREGADWFADQCQDLGLSQTVCPVEIGVRVELPAKVMKPLTDVLYEAKIGYWTKTFNDFVRTFCMCPGGYVTVENTDSSYRVKSVNGHSFQKKKSQNTNFALLVRTEFTYPFKEPNLYGSYVTGLANLLSDGILVQRLGDLLAGRRSTKQRIRQSSVRPTLKSAVPGDLAYVLPYRHLTNLMETLKAIDKIAPGVFAFDTLLYGVEVKFYSSSPKLTNCFETEIENLFACGDGAGVSRNLVHASVSGLKVAEEIISRNIKS
ncbi:MAG: FAD-dependent protein [Patescibacteria group bacterium]